MPTSIIVENLLPSFSGFSMFSGTAAHFLVPPLPRFATLSFSPPPHSPSFHGRGTPFSTYFWYSPLFSCSLPCMLRGTLNISACSLHTQRHSEQHLAFLLCAPSVLGGSLNATSPPPSRDFPSLLRGLFTPLLLPPVAPVPPCPLTSSPALGTPCMLRGTPTSPPSSGSAHRQAWFRRGCRQAWCRSRPEARRLPRPSRAAC